MKQPYSLTLTTFHMYSQTSPQHPPKKPTKNSRKISQMNISLNTQTHFPKYYLPN